MTVCAPEERLKEAVARIERKYGNGILGLGSNLGDRKANIRKALAAAGSECV